VAAGVEALAADSVVAVSAEAAVVLAAALAAPEVVAVVLVEEVRAEAGSSFAGVRAHKNAMVKTAVQQALNGLVEDLRATHGENLASVVLYGSAATGDDNELQSDYNLLIALNRITPEDLRQAQAPMREWQRLGHPLPVYFTVEELSDAADVFPIEFHQMAKARVVLYGHDPFEYAKLSDANLRHQAEYELRSKLIQLRRHYIPASISIDKLSDLMSDSLSTFAALFRAVLLLFGQQAPVAKVEVVRATAKLLNLDATSFERIFEFRAGGRLPSSEKEANELFAAYMYQIEQVVEAVDELERRGN
jgi:predicted nucleotidyltransferase